jgi:RNA polymerase-binding transcription factor DksA
MASGTGGKAATKKPEGRTAPGSTGGARTTAPRQRAAGDAPDAVVDRPDPPRPARAGTSRTAKAAPAKAAPAKTAPAKTAATNATAKATTKAAPAKKASPAAAPVKAATRAAPAKAAVSKVSATKAASGASGPGKPAAKRAARPPGSPAASPSSRRSPKAASGGRAVAELVVREDEAPWTPAELAEVRSGLEADVARLSTEIDVATTELQQLLRDSGEGTGDDQADAGAKTFEREQEISLANNSRGMLEQSLRALARLDDGSYGVCESCGRPVGKMRLLAFPRATLCVSCKQQQERR